MTIKKIGGLHFIRIGRFGASLWLTRAKAKDPTPSPVLAPEQFTSAFALGFAITFIALGVSL